MVSANDNAASTASRSTAEEAKDALPAREPAGRRADLASGSEPGAEPASGRVFASQRSATQAASDSEASPDKDLRAPLDHPLAVTYTSVRDDLGDRPEIRIGEALMLGQLLDIVIEKLKAKRANDR